MFRRAGGGRFRVRGQLRLGHGLGRHRHEARHGLGREPLEPLQRIRLRPQLNRQTTTTTTTTPAGSQLEPPQQQQQQQDLGWPLHSNSNSNSINNSNSDSGNNNQTRVGSHHKTDRIFVIFLSSFSFFFFFLGHLRGTNFLGFDGAETKVNQRDKAGNGKKKCNEK